jgi:phospholipase C
MDFSELNSPKVFISYSHDSQEHQDRVLRLADQLRQDGIDALVDQYEPAPPDGWPIWMDLEIQKADFVLLVCTDVYLRRVEHREDPGKGRGVLWEGKLIYNHLYLVDSPVQKFIPILFEGGNQTDIPTPLRTLASYSVDTGEGYQDLCRHLTNQPRHRIPALGQLKSLPPKEPQSYPASLGAPTEARFPASLDQRNRLAMLKRVREDWISGVLNQSLFSVARIELGLVSKEDSVERPSNAMLQVLDQSPAALPPGTTITKVFDEHGGALLILGAPGTGKTTLLLELAQGLLERAERDDNYPIPVIFNLSSWALRRQPLGEWLVTELNERSDVPKKIARRWVESELVLPLLDGLDEVAPNLRRQCAEAINNFRRNHGLLPIAVCSRIADYEALATKLRLRHAVLVEPLTGSQVQHYLARGGEALKPLREAVRDDSGFAELLETPLMLWVAMLAYRDAPVQTVTEEGLQQRTKRLFSRFVDAMFKRKADGRYSKLQTLTWLTWLASAMLGKKQTVFYLEDLQLDWFPTRRQRALATAGIIGGCGGVIGLVVWLGLTGELLGGGRGWVWWGLLILLVFILLGWVVGGLISALTDLRPVDVLQFRLTGFRHRARLAIRSGLLGGLLFGAIFALMVGLLLSSIGANPVRLSLILGLPSIPLFALLSWLVASVTTESVETRRKPNQGTRDSFKNAVVVLPLGGLLVGLTSGPLLGLLFGLLDDDPYEAVIPGLIAGGIIGLAGGLVGGLIGGGLFASKQSVLRLALWISGSAPPNYSSFLDYAAERLFLRKVGGGYIFVHRSVLEYFAMAGDVEGEIVSSPQNLPRRTRRTVALLIATACLIVAGVFYAFLLRRGALDTAKDAHEASYTRSTQVLQEAERKTRLRTQGTKSPTNFDALPLLAQPPGQIKHLVVVMLEERSFDHMLGGLKSVDPRVDGLTGDESNPDDAGNVVRAQPLAEFQGALKPNPDRSFSAVDLQIFGGDTNPGRSPNMQGFVKSYLNRHQSQEHSRSVMYYFGVDKVPVLATLALEFAVCDRWFSSVPGPLVPNHAFADYGSSFGRVDLNVLYFGEPFNSIYERLLGHGQRARIYQYDQTTLYFPLFLLTKQHPELFGTFQQFLTDTRAGSLPEYSFLEPNYSDRSGDEEKAAVSDQHPGSTLSADELFIAQVYNALRKNQSLWQSSVLLITYSTHGGFYDHVPPPEVTSDGFMAGAARTGTGYGFGFERLGVRVPAIIVSPYIPRGTVDHTVYEHASIPATATKFFLGEYSPRSRREIRANTFDRVLTLSIPRPDADTVVFPVEGGDER